MRPAWKLWNSTYSFTLASIILITFLPVINACNICIWMEKSEILPPFRSGENVIKTVMHLFSFICVGMDVILYLSSLHFRPMASNALKRGFRVPFITKCYYNTYIYTCIICIFLCYRGIRGALLCDHTHFHQPNHFHWFTYKSKKVAATIYMPYQHEVYRHQTQFFVIYYSTWS